MVESMTGYGRGEYRSERYLVGVELRSTNHRFLEIKLRLPRELNAWEQEMRGALRQRFSRGVLDVSVSLDRQPGTGRRFVVDETLLGQVAEGLGRAAARLGIESRIDLATLAQFRELFRFEVEPDDAGEISGGALAALEAACGELEAGRRREGEALAGSLSVVLRDLGGTLARMRELAPGVERRLREAIAARAEEVLGSGRLTPERLEQEAVLLAMKSDVTEELTRFGTHLAACEETLGGAGPVGRQLDFLVQEMHRELNTAAAKAATGELALLAIRGKTELEKVREQVQNLA